MTDESTQPKGIGYDVMLEEKEEEERRRRGHLTGGGGGVGGSGGAGGLMGVGGRLSIGGTLLRMREMNAEQRRAALQQSGEVRQLRIGE